MNNKRKSRSNTTRSSRSRPDRNVAAEGIYQNAHFMHAITSHVGNTVQNGWNVDEMFKKNEQVYGVQTSFQPSLEGYTLQLQKKDTKDYKDAEAKAAKIASEIEANPSYKARMDLENGDEEDRFASVVRPPDGQGAAMSASTGGSVEGGKYVPPAKRKNHQTGKLVRSTPPPPAQQQQQTPPPQQTQQPQPQNQPQQQPPQLPPQQPPQLPPQQPPPQPQQQTPPQQAPPPARAGGGAYLHPPPFQQPPAGAATPVVSLNPMNQPAPVPHIHGPGYAPVPPQQQPPLPQREPNKMNGIESKRPQQIRPGPRGAFNVSEPSRYPPDQSQQGPLPPRVDPKLTHHAPGGLPPAPFPSSGNAAPTSAPAGVPPQVLAAPTPVVASAAPPTLVAAPNVVPVQQPPPPTESMAPMKVVPPPEQTPMVQQGPNTNTGNASVSRKLPQASRVREDQHAELKKFGQDFKLGSGEPVDSGANDLKKQGQVQPPEEVIGNKDQQGGEPGGSSVDKVTSALKKSTLNPNAKEFVYNPNAKPFTPRSPSTPTPSRPHTPQTPQYCAAPPGAATGMAATMVMPTYVVAATNQPTPFTPQNPGNRFRKCYRNGDGKGFSFVTVPMAVPHRPDIPTPMQVTGQPLLAPAPIHTQFTVPYAQGHLPPQSSYQHVVRMVAAQQGASMVPIGPVQTSVSYHESPGPQPPPGPHQLQYMSPAPPTAMGPPHHPHPHHPHSHHHGHPPPPPASQQGPSAPGGPSPAQGATPNPPGPPHTPVGGPSNAGGAGGGAYHHHPQGGHPQSPAGPPTATYQQPPPGPPQGHPPSGPPHTFPIMCPILPTGQLPPGAHTPHHPMMQPTSMQQAAVQYIHHQHHQVGSTQPHHIQVILPHNQ
ncbi:uncharacterized protein [Periplaneta americana]|uniref:uncharacterized protein isoform X3 n=1 Tax=Periplaneta americana TaxID=6978 RepID=UPI0037E75207